MLILSLVFTIVLAGCSDSDTPSSADSQKPKLTHVILMTDWYPQPEHGGFYQALAKGYYRDAGLDVEIRPGANISDIRPLVATQQVNFGIGTSDTTLIGISRGLPLVGIFPYFQHDPQCIMFHPQENIKTLKDLDGREIMMQPSLSYTEYMTKIMGLDLHLIPMDFSLSRFATNEHFIQQCFVTSEPIHLKQQGIDTRLIPLSESGFDPYRHIYTSTEFLKNNPEVVKAFAEASVKGWQDFINGDPTPAFQLIAKENSQQNMDFMQATLAAMKQYKIVYDENNKQETLGKYRITRLEQQIDQLKKLGLVDQSMNMNTGLFAVKQLPMFYEQ